MVQSNYTTRIISSSHKQTPFHHPNSSKMFVTKPHSGIIVLMLSRLLPVSWQCHTVVSDRTVSNLSPHSGIIVLMLSRLLPVSWQCHTVVSDRTVFNLSPHTGIIVLMLSRLLPVSWQCHTVVSDHTAPNLSLTTPHHTTIIHLSYISTYKQVPIS